MLKLLLEAVLGRRRVRTLRRLLAAVTAAVILVPGAAAAVFLTVIYVEQAQITPVLKQMVHHLSEPLDRGQLQHPLHALQPRLH